MAQKGYLWSIRASPASVEVFLMRSKAQEAHAIDTVRDLFRAAEFSAAAQRLRALLEQRPDAVDAAMLLARVEMRRGDPARALADLTRYGRNARKNAKAELTLLKAVAFARSGDTASARTQFRSAQSLIHAGDELHAELVYQLAAAEWIERRLDRAAKLLERLPEKRSPNIDLHVAILRGAIASAGENLAAQGAILLDALRRADDGNADVYLYAMLVTQIASLALELPSTALRDAAIARVDTVRWTTDIADLHFHAARAIAWRHALDGDEFSAFRRLKEALNAANSDAWRVAALTDRAYLAAALGERRWAAQELRDAHELASAIDWASVAGEEKLALPVLAELFAGRDPSVAIAYVTTFKDLDKNFPRILSSRRDRRVDALEAYSLGRVQLALGERREAKRLLENAWSIYDKLGMQWRAGRAALSLAEVDDAVIWRERAHRALENYPRSWLTRHAAAPPPLIASPHEPQQLTRAQRAVLELLLEGHGTEEIARALGRSTFTVRNHIKAIFKSYGVTSRSALIVRATRG